MWLILQGHRTCAASGETVSSSCCAARQVQVDLLATAPSQRTLANRCDQEVGAAEIVLAVLSA